MKNGWQERSFEECIERVTYTQKVQRKDFLNEGQFPIISQEEAFINGYWDNEAELFKVETPLIIFGDHTKVLKYVDFDFVLGADGVKILQPCDFLVPKFFFYQLQSLSLETLGYARHYRLLRGLNIAFPTRNEQKRIVRALDEAFEAIAVAKANAEKNLQNARAIFDGDLHAKFAEAWRTSPLVPLHALATAITDGDHLPPPKSVSGVPFITIGNIVKETRQISFADTFMVPRKYFDGLKAQKKPQKGDVLYTVTGSYGIPVIVESDVEFCFQRHIGLIRPAEGVDTHWMYHLLGSPQVMDQAHRGATGAAQKTVSLSLLRSFEVPKVPFSQQKRMANDLDRLSTETRHLQSRYDKKLAALDDLKKSLLHQAFTDKL